MVRREGKGSQRARQVEHALLRAGAVFLKSESSHKVYRAPNGRKFHLCFSRPGEVLGPMQIQAAWAAMREGSQT